MHYWYIKNKVHNLCCHKIVAGIHLLHFCKQLRQDYFQVSKVGLYVRVIMTHNFLVN